MAAGVAPVAMMQAPATAATEERGAGLVLGFDGVLLGQVVDDHVQDGGRRPVDVLLRDVDVAARGCFCARGVRHESSCRDGSSVFSPALTAHRSVLGDTGEGPRAGAQVGCRPSVEVSTRATLDRCGRRARLRIDVLGQQARVVGGRLMRCGTLVDAARRCSSDPGRRAGRSTGRRRRCLPSGTPHDDGACGLRVVCSCILQLGFIRRFEIVAMPAASRIGSSCCSISVIRVDARWYSSISLDGQNRGSRSER